MKWECHSCGCDHEEVPQRCRSCGTEPEIVANLWRCPSCGHEGNLGTHIRCGQCGAEMGAQAETAVAPEQRLNGPAARALLQGPWRMCAYCGAQAPPVKQDGTPIESCPACGGPLIEATRQAAVQDVSAEEAHAFRKQEVVPVRPEAPPLAPRAQVPPRARPGLLRRMARGGLRLLGGFVALLVLLMIVAVVVEHRSRESLSVADHTWERYIQVEEAHAQTGEGWEKDLPAAAHDKVCTQRPHGTQDVPDGVETLVKEEKTGECAEYRDIVRKERYSSGSEEYDTQEEDGKTCVNFGYKKNGGVSVKTCAEWKPRYKTVKRTRPAYQERDVRDRVCATYKTRAVEQTRPRFRKEPVLASYCTYVVDEWVAARKLTKTGSGDGPRSWPAVGDLAPSQRATSRGETLGLLLRRRDKSTVPYEVTRATGEADAAAVEKWGRYRPGQQVVGVVLRDRVDHLTE